MSKKAKEQPKYRETLNLPQTEFPMRAQLPVREPERVRRWQESRLYDRMHKQAKAANRPKFILHDGPPYANGSIHQGHILNKVLKDMVVKYRFMTGYNCHFVPGWDCHGLPIEQKISDRFREEKKNPSREEILEACQSFAQHWVDTQREGFLRLGVLGDYDHPYKTLTPEYEGRIAREFARLVREGYVYRGLKPVYWDWYYETALAEAEIEYEDHASPSIYVPFELKSPSPASIDPKLRGETLELVIWTTTPWTLPANLAIAVNREFEYAAVKASDRVFVVAKNLVERFTGALVLDGTPEVIATFPAGKLEGGVARHPFLDRDSKILFGDFVTLEQGSGCVHIAPGHGQDDYELGRANGLEVLCPVDSQGRYTPEVGLPELEGQFVLDANEPIKKLLKEKNRLLNDINARNVHSYPHSWRSKKPIIFRATSQWFVDLSRNELRKKGLAAIDRVRWVPTWGRDRIYSMLENRPDWTLSRQRVWGVPIPAYECRACGHVELNADVCEHVAGIIENEGIAAWTKRPIEDLLPAGTTCPKCGGTDLMKGADILDVWFDSGVSHAAVLEANDELAWPADLYLEGSDQHRGWFHSSLLTSVATRGDPPYKAVLTHGFVVDGNGRKYSKSNPNYQPPEEIIERYGVDILRLWVASEDYRYDIAFSDEIIQRMVESYRKFRNTIRYMLGNLHDFNPGRDWVPHEKLAPIDQWIVGRLNRFVERALQAYEDYDFHVVYHRMNEFLTVDFSALFADISKDRLYVEKPDDPLRRSKQTALYQILAALCRVVAPVLSFTCEETFEFLPRFEGKAPHPTLEGINWDSVFLSRMPEPVAEEMSERMEETFTELWRLRDAVNEKLEEARREKRLNKTLEAAITAHVPAKMAERLEATLQNEDIRDALIVSALELKGDGDQGEIRVEVGHASGATCERCWHVREDVGRDVNHPELCTRCVTIIA